jgi:hypothetical protein
VSANEVNPEDILYSMPTINDGLPDDYLAGKIDKDTLVIHEDNWRQFEFVSRKHRDAVNAELLDIDRIWKEQAVDVGGGLTAFRSLHVRQRIPVPLDIEFSAQDFSSLFGAQGRPLTFQERDHVLKDIAAIQAGGFIFYAHVVRGRLVTLGIEHGDDKPHLDHQIAANVGAFMRTHDLGLIHWRSRSVFISPEVVERYLATGK